MATQQATPATHSRDWAAPVDRPKGRNETDDANDVSAAAMTAGGRRRISSASAAIDTAANSPIARVGRAPTITRHEMLHDRWPHRAGKVVAARANGDRGTAAAREPQRCIRDQRPEHRRTAQQADQHAVRQRQGPDVRRHRCQRESQPEARRADQQRHPDAEAIRETAHEQAARAKADQSEHIRQ